MILKSGKVYLVGAGPGDPELVTLKGLRLIKEADVILYDRLIPQELLGHAKPGAETIYVGKEPAGQCHPQEEINNLLLCKAKEGKTVVRLKGGDPFLLSRGAEEMEFLLKHGIPVEPVPGVSSSIAAPEYAGIPLTHRKYASSFAVITGHENSNKPFSSIQWEKLAMGTDTLVFLMGIRNLEKIVANLIQYGRPPQTPSAVIQWGSTLHQKTITAPLQDLPQRLKVSGIQAPSVLVVGDVVRCRDALNWFETKPLFGRKIGISRSRNEMNEFMEALRREGGEAVPIPLFRILPPESWNELDAVLQNLKHFDWLVFSSGHAVEAFFGRINQLELDEHCISSLQIAAVGQKTANSLKEKGIHVDFLPKTFTGEGLAEALRTQNIQGKKFLIPRGNQALEGWHKILEDAKASVTAPICYRNLPVQELEPEVLSLIQEGGLDMICFTSPSSVRNWSKLLKKYSLTLPETTQIASIGPTTAAEAKELLGRNDLEPEIHTLEGLAQAIINRFKNLS